MDKICGIIKGGKHSYYDFGLKIMSREFNPPSKKKIKEEIPFVNGAYDFSLLYGENIYEERTIKYVFDLRYKNKIDFLNKKIAIIDWLTSNSKEALYDDLVPGYYFIAECEDSILFDEGYIDCEVTVVFTAYPFKISKYNEGNIPWNDFNFELDYLQQIKFQVSGSKSINIINPSSKKISPTVICSGSFEVIKGNTTYKFNSGTTKDWRFTLDKGDNSLILKGNGNIEFVFRKEVL